MDTAIALMSALVVAFFTAIFAYRRYIHEQKQQGKMILNSLFGELSNIVEHYCYAAFELPKDCSDIPEMKMRLRWSMYGKLRSTNDVTRFGFLDASDIRALLQLELRIRNDNILLEQCVEQLLDPPNSISEKQIDFVRNRLASRIEDAMRLLNRLFREQPQLKEVFNDMKDEINKNLPSTVECPLKVE